MKQCIFELNEEGTRYECIECRFSYRGKFGPDVRADCGRNIVDGVRGLGDQIESGLKSVGVTEERIKSFKGMLGLKKSCRCQYRKRLMNLTFKYAKQYGWIKAVKNIKEIKRYLDEPR